jgi:hypothetical protein
VLAFEIIERRDNIRNPHKMHCHKQLSKHSRDSCLRSNTLLRSRGTCRMFEPCVLGRKLDEGVCMILRFGLSEDLGRLARPPLCELVQVKVVVRWRRPGRLQEGTRVRALQEQDFS